MSSSTWGEGVDDVGAHHGEHGVEVHHGPIAPEVGHHHSLHGAGGEQAAGQCLDGRG
jgi:hypothetical protein